MSQRSGDLFTSRHDALEAANAPHAMPPPAQDEEKEEEEEEDMNPLQLEHMLGYAGDFPKSILTVPSNENLIIKSLSSVVSIEDMTDPHSQRFLRGHDMPISALAVSKSGTLIASSQVGTKYYKGWAAPVFIWQTSTGKRVIILKGLSVRTNLLSISDDERFLCGCDEDSNMIIWDLLSSEVVGSIKLPAPATVQMWVDQKKQVHSIDYELVVGAGNLLYKTDFTYDTMRMQWSIKIKPYQMPVSGGIVRTFKCGCLTPDRLFVCLGTTGGEMMIYRRDTYVFRGIVPVCTNGLNDMVCLPDGAVVCGGGDGTISKLIGSDGAWRQSAQSKVGSRVNSLSASSNGSEIIVGDSAGTVYRCLADTFMHNPVSLSHTSAVTSVAFSLAPASNNNSQYLFATGTSCGKVRMWDLTDYACLSTFRNPKSGAINCLALVDNNNVISGSQDGAIRSTDSGGRLNWEIPVAHRDGVKCLSIHVDPTLQYFVSGGSDGVVRIWKYSNRELVTGYSEHRHGVLQCCIDTLRPNIVHSVGGDNSVLSYDIKANRRVISHTMTGGMLLSLAQRIDSEQELITGDNTGRLLHWDIDARDAVMVMQDPARGSINTCQVSKSGRYLAFAGSDRVLKVLDIPKSQMVSVGQSHSDTICTLTWTPDDRQIVTGGADNSLSIWNFFLAGGQ